MNIGVAGGAGLRQRKKYVFNNQLIRSGDMSLQQQKAWLSRSAQWPTIAANNYVGKTVLGAGANGIVGAWELDGNSLTLPKVIVVKQSFDRFAESAETLRVESKLMRDILGTNTSHVVKLYKSYHQEGGSGSNNDSDPLPFTDGVWNQRLLVNRIYMEYCPSGSLESKVDKIFATGEVVPEEYIWRLLHCLASALVVLRHGNEDPRFNAPTWDTPIVHFDLKPANVLIGQHNDSHRRLPVFKLADFGLSLPLPAAVLSKEEWDSWAGDIRGQWTDEALWRHTPGHSPPEQISPKICDGRIGYRSDIWCVGVILYQLMTGTLFQRHRDVEIMGITRTRFEVNTFTYTEPSGRQYATHGRDIIYTAYSRALINLTHMCLAHKPVYRPKPRQLLRAVNHVLANIYDRPPGVQSRGKKVQLDQGIANVHQYNDPFLAHYTDRQIQRFRPTHPGRAAFLRNQTANSWWEVGPEVSLPGLPPLIPGTPLDPTAWPWDNTVQPPGAARPSARQTRAAAARARAANQAAGN